MTSLVPTMSAATRGVTLLSRAGRPGRALALEAERLRALGVRHLRTYRWTSEADVSAALAAAISGAYRRIWQQAADAAGAEVRPLRGDFLVISSADRQTVVHRQLVMLDHPATIALALDKSVSQGLLAEAGLPVPVNLTVDRDDRATALRFLADSPHPCVIKPGRETSGGTGVTCGIETPDDLLRSWVDASRWSDRIMVERQTPGDGYRLTFLDGELIGAVRRRSPQVVGDGRTSVAELINQENRRRVAAGADDVARLIFLDLDLRLRLRRAGLDLASVPPAGTPVTIKTSVSDNGLLENEVVDELSADLVEEARAAVALMRLRLAGVDLVTPDSTRSLRSAGGAILEVNGTPGLHYHYQVAQRPTTNPVAVPVLERLLSDSARGQLG